MENALSELVTRTIDHAEIDLDGVGISLCGGWSIAAFNRCKLVDREGASQVVTVPALLGATIKAVETTERELAITLDNGSCLIVSLKDDDFLGPEAVLVRGPGSELIVLN
ncbi:MAG: hypothetical protein EON61_19890 [Alphaproteobacteria bacterium]|nr:MAG: hypothetical protein EON61_19890 [Alphaproteobacteria bacterium]